MKRRGSLLMVLAMTALLATTAVAAAAVWKDKGTEVTEKREFNLTGAEVFETPEGGMSCGVKATILIENGTTSKVTKYSWDGAACSAFGEKYASCKLSTWTATGLPWTIEGITTTSIKIKSETVKRTFVAGCPILTLESTVTGGIWTPPTGTAGAIAEFEMGGGTGTAKKEKTTTVEYKSFGSLTVDSPNSGTYGIG